MIRIAAVGDVHYDRHPRAQLRDDFAALSERADLLLLAGDLTQAGYLEEAEALAEDLQAVRVPVLAVAGNHDFHQNREGEIRAMFRERGIVMLEGESTIIEIRGVRVGVMGLKGFGGGFFGACVTEFGEPETKAFARHARIQADILKEGLLALDEDRADLKVALLHYAPIDGTLLGEKREIYPFLGSHLLAEAIDAAGADVAFHGHAHMGTEKGATAGGIPVRNVAMPVIRHAYHVYTFDPSRERFRDRFLNLDGGLGLR